MHSSLVTASRWLHFRRSKPFARSTVDWYDGPILYISTIQHCVITGSLGIRPKIEGSAWFAYWVCMTLEAPRQAAFQYPFYVVHLPRRNLSRREFDTVGETRTTSSTEPSVYDSFLPFFDAYRPKRVLLQFLRVLFKQLLPRKCR
jgi:hypothetical protein